MNKINKEIFNNPRNYIYAAKRLNNAKRRHLYVNAYQAKHMPVRGEDALLLFDGLAEKLKESAGGKRLLIIGFAETATAIGARLAEKAAPNGYFAATTRELDPDGEYIEFTESHSHAKRQFLNVRGLDEAVRNADRIVFAEDEITTGRTIEKLINKLNERYPDAKLKYTIISVLNSLTEERKEELKSRGINCVCLYRIEPEWLAGTLDGLDFTDGESSEAAKSPEIKAKIDYIDVPYINQRTVSKAEAYSKAAHAFAEEAVNLINLGEKDKDILVLGTEEFMYSAVLAAAKLENKYPGKNILTHSTTRSPIEVCANANYPLFNRTPIVSLYENDRANFIYNLKPCDRVFVLTDAKETTDGTFREFVSSLTETGAKEVEILVWGGNNK